MAQATDEQVKQLEKALTEQFFNLVQGAKFRINLARLGDPNKPLSDNKAFINYSVVYSKLVDNWLQRESKYEVQLLKKGIKGLIASGDLKRDDFIYAASLPKLDALVKKYNAEPIHGIGFIPLLIWAVIAIAGFFTAKEITDDLTTTTQEKEQLMNTTVNTCHELKLTPDQCNKMVTQTQAEANSSGGGFMDILKYGLITTAVGIFLPKILEHFSHSKSKS